MEKFTQKWCLVAFFQPLADGTEFDMKDWPQHVTLAGVFAVEWTGQSLSSELRALCAASAHFQLSALHDTELGSPKHPVEVTLLEKSPQLLELHRSIVARLEAHGAVFNTPEHNKQGFLPHSTVQKSGRLHTGDSVTIASVTLVDMFPSGDANQRKIVETYSLGESS